MSDNPEPMSSGQTTPSAQERTNAGGSQSFSPQHESEAANGADSTSDSTGVPRRRRRGSRGGRNRSSAAKRAAAAAETENGEKEASPSDQAASDPSAVEVGAVGSADSTGKPARPRRSPARRAASSADGGTESERSKANSKEPPERTKPSSAEPAALPSGLPRDAPKPRIGDTRPAVAADPDIESTVANDERAEGTGRTADPTTPGPARRRRRRGGRHRGSGRKPVEASLTDVADEAIELDEETLEKRRGRERKGRPVGRYLMCVQVREAATQIAVLEGRSLIEHYVSRPHDDISQIDGNIYLTKVQNVLPGMEAAFIDIGTPKNAVLYRGDVRYDADDMEGTKKDHARIEQMIKGGQQIVCQVTKNPIGTKGARLTQEVSLPGRFVVLMPNSSTYGISKRLADDERKRLRKVLDEVKPEQHGIIVRTAAEGATADELRRDVLRLVKQWEDIDKLASRSQAPALLYREPDMAVRIIREEFNKNYRGVIIDDPQLFREVRDYVASISPELADRIELFDRSNEPLPLFERYHVHEQLHKALDRKVWLPSGGSLIIERTEALTVIDVNTGKNVGKSNLEETVFRNNLEAAEEIAHQLRLRDIGGIIVIDFIDMEIKKNRDEVLNKLRDALARDKTRTQAYAISELGLVEMTRKRISEGLVESFSESCPNCNSRGFVIDEKLLAD